MYSCAPASPLDSECAITFNSRGARDFRGEHQIRCVHLAKEEVGPICVRDGIIVRTHFSREKSKDLCLIREIEARASDLLPGNCRYWPVHGDIHPDLHLERMIEFGLSLCNGQNFAGGGSKTVSNSDEKIHITH
jgi:hypothetical protein